jgi:hypothetical protein
MVAGRARREIDTGVTPAEVLLLVIFDFDKSMSLLFWAQGFKNSHCRKQASQAEHGPLIG